MKTNIFAIAALALVASLAGAASAQAASPNWNTTGNYEFAFKYLGVDTLHNVSLTQDSAGALTGNGGSPAGANVYTWAITSGAVSGNTVSFTANYTATADAVTPQTVFQVTGVVASNGIMSGTWSDNYQGGTRSGTWTASTGKAVALGALKAEDFGVVNYDTGLGFLKGYTAGFGLASSTFAGVKSVVVKLYAGDKLLQTNTATAQFGAEITGNQFSSPFDVSGTFDYVEDGYWSNVKQKQYGQSLAATKVVATVKLANGVVVTAQNTVLTGDPKTIFKVASSTATSTPSGIAPTNKKQCKKGGWMSFTKPVFKNQGQCIKFAKRLKDNRGGRHGEDRHDDDRLRNFRGFNSSFFDSFFSKSKSGKHGKHGKHGKDEDDD